MGWHLSRLKYGTNAPVLLNMVEDFTINERGVEDGMVRLVSFGTLVGFRSWIPAGLMHDLTDNNIDNVQGSYFEEANAWTNSQIFNALDSDVHSPQEFRNRLLYENSYREQGDVEYLFEAYYFN